MSTSQSDRNVLFGVLAYKCELIDLQQLLAVCGAWAAEQSKPVPDLLGARGWLSTTDREFIEGVVKRKLARHHNNARATLQSVMSPEVLAALRQVEGMALPKPPEIWPFRQWKFDREQDSESSNESDPAESRYTWIREVGEGGLGKVWLARDNNLAREVAIKEIKPGFESSQSVRRLIKEAQITGQLQHPNIVPVYEVIRGGRPFYAMKLVDGETLSDAIQRHHAQRRAGHADRLSLPRLLNAFVNVCEALAYAHSRGVIHRDLKPQNVVLGGYGEVIVLDWGLAKVMGESDDDAPPIALSPDAQTDLTRAGATFGTPAYMAPEQAAGRIDLIDPRTDIFGLGAMLFEILTGQPPYLGKDITELLNRIITGEAPRARSVGTRKDGIPFVPAALDTICGKAMAKWRSHRYPTAVELARDVQLWLAESSEEAVRTRRLLYVAHMNLAQTAWENNQVGRVRELLEAHRPIEDQEDLRGFEWYYWNRLCNSALLELKGHTAAVYCVAFSADGQQLVSCGEDDTVRVWDAITGEEIHSLKGHSEPVINVAFSVDGQRVASASEDETTKIWDANGWRVMLTLKGHSGIVHSVAFSADGRRLVTASSDKTAKVWNALSGKHLLTFEEHTDWVHSVAFCQDGQRIASASHDQTVKVWESFSGRTLLTLQGHTGGVNCVAFSADGQRLASGGDDQTVRVWETTSGQESLILMGHSRDVTSVVFSADGRRLASSSSDQTVKIWDTSSGRELFTIKGHSGRVARVTFSSGGDRLATASEDTTVRVWPTVNNQTPFTLKGHFSVVSSVAFSSDGQRLASASLNGMVKVWMLATNPHGMTSGQEMFTLKACSEAFPYAFDRGWGTTVAFAPNGLQLASGVQDHRVKVWDMTSGLELFTLSGHAGPVTTVAYSADGKSLASGSCDQTLRLCNLASQEVTILTGHSAAVRSVAFSRDGKYLASASQDGTVKVWNATSGQLKLTLREHNAPVYSVAFSRDGQQMASAGADNTVRVWDSATGEQLMILKGHTECVNSAAFSPNGQRLVSASSDRTVKVWDAVTSQEMLTLTGHTESVSSVAFSPDGKRLASASHDQTVKIWNATPRNRD